MNDKCYATGVVLEVNKEKLEIQVKLIESCPEEELLLVNIMCMKKLMESIK